MIGAVATTVSPSIDAAAFPLCEFNARTELTELVRGSEQELIERLCPLVKRQNMTLDLSSVKRIDAAGVAALILLHVSAREAGQSFTVVNPSPHVAEILALTGVDRYLLSRNMVQKSHSGPSFEQPAA